MEIFYKVVPNCELPVLKRELANGADVRTGGAQSRIAGATRAK